MKGLVALAIVFLCMSSPSICDDLTASQLWNQTADALFNKNYETAIKLGMETIEIGLIEHEGFDHLLAPYHHTLAKAYYGQKQLELALEQATFAVEKAAFNRYTMITARRTRAMILSDLGRYDAAISDTDSAYDLTDDDGWRVLLLSEKVRFLKAAGRTEPSVNLAHDIVSNSSLANMDCCGRIFSDLYWFLSRHYNQLGELLEAKNQLMKALPYARGTLRFQSHHNDQLLRDPRLKRYLYDLAKIYFQDNRYVEARGANSEALGVFPREGGPQAHSLILAGLIEKAQGIHSSAHSHFEDAVTELNKIQHTSRQTIERLSLLSYWSDYNAWSYKGDDATKGIKGVVDSMESRQDTENTTYTDALYILAEVHSTEGRWREAEAVYQKLIALNPEDRVFDVLLGLADLYAEQGYDDLSLKLLDRALAQAAKISEVGSDLDSLGLLTVLTLKRAVTADAMHGTSDRLKKALDDIESTTASDGALMSETINNGQTPPFKVMERYIESISLIYSHLPSEEKLEVEQLIGEFLFSESLRGKDAIGKIQLQRARDFIENEEWTSARMALFAYVGLEQNDTWRTVRYQHELALLEYNQHAETYGRGMAYGARDLVERIEYADSRRAASERLSYRRKVERLTMLDDALHLLVQKRIIEAKPEYKSLCQRDSCATRDEFIFADTYHDDRSELAFRAYQRANKNSAEEALNKLTQRLAAEDSAMGLLIRRQQNALETLIELEGQIRQASVMGLEWQGRSIDNIQLDISATGTTLDKLNERIATEYPKYSEMAASPALTFEETKDFLRPGEAIISYFLGERGVHAFVITEEKAIWQSLKADRSEIREMVKTLRRGLDPTGGQTRGMDFDDEDEYDDFGLPYDRHIAHDLYNILLAPFAEELQDSHHLYIVPHDGLINIPFSVLVTDPVEFPFAVDSEDMVGTSWLIRQKAVTTLPSISSLMLFRANASATKGTGFIGVGDPIIGAQSGSNFDTRSASILRSGVGNVESVRALSPLPETAVELRQLQSYFTSSQNRLLLGDEASEPLIRSGALDDYSVIAFATHGLIAGELKGLAEPALVLTPPDVATSENDGLLMASEVAELNLSADWVLLSACNTAASDSSRGAEGLSGLARSFFYAGARSLLVSHWPVDSQSAVYLTTGTFSALNEPNNTGRSDALRQSILRLANGELGIRYTHPSMWAPFVLVGEGS